MKYVATTTDVAPVHTAPDSKSESFPIEVGKGSKVTLIDFVDGFGKVLYWRSYVAAPATRAPGFALSMFPILALLIGGIAGALRHGAA